MKTIAFLLSFTLLALFSFSVLDTYKKVEPKTETDSTKVGLKETVQTVASLPPDTVKLDSIQLSKLEAFQTIQENENFLVHDATQKLNIIEFQRLTDVAIKKRKTLERLIISMDNAIKETELTIKQQKQNEKELQEYQKTYVYDRDSIINSVSIVQVLPKQ